MSALRLNTNVTYEKWRTAFRELVKRNHQESVDLDTRHARKIRILELLMVPYEKVKRSDRAEQQRAIRMAERKKQARELHEKIRKLDQWTEREKNKVDEERQQREQQIRGEHNRR